MGEETVVVSNQIEGAELANPSGFVFLDDEDNVIGLEEAKKRRWAHVKDGTPTKIYLHHRNIIEAMRKGLPVPVRPKAKYEAGQQQVNGIPSPYDLSRRSGYGVIWEVLAEHVGQFVPHDVLSEEVNRRLAERFPEWYSERYAEKPYDTKANAYILSRAPHNAKIEEIHQRVDFEPYGVRLRTNVTEPRQLKKRGRKPKAIINAVSSSPVVQTVEVDEDNAVLVSDDRVAVEVSATE